MSLRYTFHPVPEKGPQRIEEKRLGIVPEKALARQGLVKAPLQEASKELWQNPKGGAQADLMHWFGEQLVQIFLRIRDISFKDIEEIRLRIDRPLLFLGSHKEFFIDDQGRVVAPEQGYPVQREDIFQALERMTQSSLYAAEEEMKQGFITLPGGHRVGITGEAILKNGELQTLKHISALNIRLAKAVEGRAEQILPKLLRRDGSLYHTLILSPPRAGKTTLLRDLIRKLSDGSSNLNIRGQTVGVVDERRELAGMWQGVPAYNLGCRTDVLDGCPKRLGINMLVRSMSPQVIAVDELGHPGDAEAVLDALRTGVKILSTAHATDLEEALRRPTLKPLFEFGVFERVVVISRRQGPGTIEKIIMLDEPQVIAHVGK